MMKKLTGVVAVFLMGGTVYFGISERVANEVLAAETCDTKISKEECDMAGGSCMWDSESNACDQYSGSYDDMLEKYYGIKRDDKE